MGLSQPVSVGNPRPDLEAAWGAWDAAAMGYIAELVLPAMDVDAEEATLGAIPKEVFTQYVDAKRSAKSESAETSFDLEKDTYRLYEYSLKGFVAQRDTSAWKSFFKLEEIEVMRLRHMIMRSYEVDTAAAVFNTTAFPLSGNTGVTVSNAWSDAANGVPQTDVNTGHEAFETNWGMRANALILTRKKQRQLALNTQVRGALPDSAFKKGIVDESALLDLFNVDRVIIAGAEVVRNTANPGQSASLSPIWDTTKALLTRLGNPMDPYTPSLGFTLKLTGEGDVMIKSEDKFDPEGRTLKANFVRLAKRSKYPPGYLLAGL